MDAFTKGILNKVDKAYITIEKLTKKYPGSRGYVILECKDFNKETVRVLGAFYHIGILKDSTHIVLDEKNNQVFNFKIQNTPQGKCLNVYDADYNKAGTVVKDENMFRSEKVSITKFDIPLGEIAADNSTNIKGLRINHTLLGMNYEIYKNDELAMIKKNENGAQAIVMLDGIKETEGILLAAGMRFLHTPVQK